MSTFPFWGFTATTSSNDHGAIGVEINGVRMLTGVYETGRRLAEAGADGLPVDGVSRSDVAILRSAGIGIQADHFGLNYHLTTPLTEPSKWIVRAPARPAPVKHGQYNASLRTRNY